MNEQERDLVLRQIAADLLAADTEAERVLVFNERPDVHPRLDRTLTSALIVKVSKRGARRQDPTIFGFPPIEERPFPIGVTKVHPVLIPNDCIGFEAGAAWGGPPLFSLPRAGV